MTFNDLTKKSDSCLVKLKKKKKNNDVSKSTVEQTIKRFEWMILLKTYKIR